MTTQASATEAIEVNRINLSWLVRLRWGAVGGQALTIAFVQGVMRIDLPLAPLAALVALELVINVACLLWLHSGRRTTPGTLAAVMAADVVLLTGLLFFSGGPFNPFSLLYVVHLALATLVVKSPWTWVLVGLALLCSGALFYGHVWLGLEESSPDSHLAHMQMHLQGMWVALAVAASFIVYFLTRVRRALYEREAALAEQRAVAARQERLVSLATLSAGAAHELATPLGTIAVAARELERAASTLPAAALEDVHLIREQVERCRQILEHMAADAGDPAGEAFVAVSAEALLRQALEELPADPAVDVAAIPAATIFLPRRAVAQAIRAVIKNGQQAARDTGGKVSLACSAADGAVVVTITDDGAGMSAEVQRRLGEPFFTTKPPGRGMGLGLFLSKTVIDRVGGGIDITSTPGRGTCVTVRLPLGGRRSESAQAAVRSGAAVTAS
jgi:two-component system sensor histidine kinase RegB